MAKLVIAGKADCPYYAKVELLADQLANSVNSLNVHKIVKTPEEWEKWLTEECKSRKFAYSKSPIIWRELVDRGGKGTLIGGANEFQEYVLGYYGVKSSLCTSDITKIAGENLATKLEIDAEQSKFKSQSNPMKICITNAGSPVCYHLLNTIATGEIFGEEQELAINLLGKEDELESLAGIEMEVVDLARNLVRGITVSSQADIALNGCEAVIVLDQLTREEEESEESWLNRNANMLIDRIKVVDVICKQNVKVLVAGNGPINNSLYMIQEHITNIDRHNVIAMPRLIENQAKAIIAGKVNVKTSDVVDVVIWGDNEKYFCDINQARVHNHDGPIWGPPSYSRLANILIHEEQWLAKEFLEILQTRYDQEKTKMRHVPAFSHAAAINSLVTQWWFGSPDNQLITLGVVSEGWYDVPKGMVFNFPARISSTGEYEVVKDLELSEESKLSIKECIDYLLEQRYQLFPDQRPTPPPEPEKSEGVTDSPHPPTMTPIKEETDIELRPTAEESGAETPPSQSETDVHGATSAEPTMAKIQEDLEPTEDDVQGKEDETTAEPPVVTEAPEVQEVTEQAGDEPESADVPAAE